MSRASARLQSLCTTDPADKTDFVHAARHFKARRWVKRKAAFGSGFLVAVWRPLDQPAPTPELLALKDRPPPTVRKAKEKKTLKRPRDDAENEDDDAPPADDDAPPAYAQPPADTARRPRRCPALK
ncbi:hypothetical protein M885DRAFT_613356 [Pelagophyceae sp. CCMP2097]|nr:hypothetical protein M885DRAFT_613356 [Pelagophyceae sp. CCMP2097]